MATNANPKYLYGVTDLLELFAEAAKHHEDQAAKLNLGEHEKSLYPSLASASMRDFAVAARAKVSGATHILCTHPLLHTTQYPIGKTIPTSLSTQNNAGQLRFLREIPSVSAPI